MRVLLFVAIACIGLVACDKARVYEQNEDFENGYWLVTEKPEFDFLINRSIDKHTLYANIRNSVSYPYARIFYTYYLLDSTGAELEKKLISQFLFDGKTGKPFGSSGLGDIYDHQLELLKDYQFKYPGKYTVRFEQFMRVDTLQGILALGLRVENSTLKRSQ
jgi:gliding motility-associated lipoprotein GldH